MTWIVAWQAWMKKLNDDLAAKGIPLIPNTSAFTTTWDNTDYGLTAGIFDEGFAGTELRHGRLDGVDQRAAQALRGRQDHDPAELPDERGVDVATRMYYLGNYLLVKGRHTYLEYFASGPLEWYPEWKIDLGAPSSGTAADVSSLLQGGVYRRDFAKGSVLVNPGGSPVTVPLGGDLPARRAERRRRRGRIGHRAGLALDAGR